MKLDQIQTALFAAYDLRNFLPPEVMEMTDDTDETVGDRLSILIEFLESLEDEVQGETV